MAYQTNKLRKLVNFMEQYSLQEGANMTRIEQFGTFKASVVKGRTPIVDAPMIIIVACFCAQHSPILGQAASSQTVFSFSLRISSRVC